MATVTAAFTAVGNGSVLLVHNCETYTYTVTGTFVGTWVVETSKDAVNFTALATGTTTQAAVTVKVIEGDTSSVHVRFRCSAFTSGTITGVLADAADLVKGSGIKDNKNNTVFRAVDGGIEVLGTLDVSGVLSAGSFSGPMTGALAEIGFAASDETTDLTTGTGKLTFRMPYAMTLTAVRSNVNTAPTDAAIIVDINEGGSTILSTKLSIDATEKTSLTASSAAVISDAALANDAEITVDIDQIGSTAAGKGLKIWLIGTRA